MKAPSLKQLKNGLNRLDAKAVKCELSKQPLQNPRMVKLVVRTVVESGCLILQRRDDSSVAKRDALRDVLVDWITQRGNSEAKSQFQKHLQEASVLELGYENILHSLHLASDGLEPQTHVWSAIASFEASFARLAKAGEDTYKTMTQERHPWLGARPNLIVEDGEELDPDAALHILGSAFADTLLLFAYRHGWLDGEGKVVLPPRPEAVLDRPVGEVTRYLASVWQVFDYASERARFWGAGLTLQHPAGLGNPEIKVERIPSFELFEEIARYRQQYLAMEVGVQWGRVEAMMAAADDIDRDSLQSIYSHRAEQKITMMLELTRHFSPQTDNNLYGGLTLREWVRSYSVLARCVQQLPLSSQLVELDSCELLKRLRSAGVEGGKETIFLREATFGQGKRDLHDAPLIKIGPANSHRYCVHKWFCEQTLLWEAITSQIGSLRSGVAQSGRQYELEVNLFFEKQGIPAKRFGYKFHGDTFDCDCVVLWEDHLFIFECKNVGLPTGAPGDSFRFVSEMIEASDQVRRIGRHFQVRPDLVKRQFGPGATWRNVHVCVLNALPYALPFQLRGAFVYDFRALNKFFEENGIGISLTRSSSVGSVGVHIPTKKLWDGEAPRPTDLLRQMKSALQVEQAINRFRLLPVRYRLSDNLSLTTAGWVIQNPSYSEALDQHGVTVEELESIKLMFDELAEEIG